MNKFFLSLAEVIGTKNATINKKTTTVTGKKSIVAKSLTMKW